jgi:hypothetical protein
MTDLRGLLERLVNAGVEFMLVGGVAATAHGSARLTYALDVVYARGEDNLRRLVDALADLHPYLRGAPPGLPFRWDAETLRRGLNFTLTTDAGPIDLLGEITGGGGYPNLLPHCVRLAAFGLECDCLGLRRLVDVKRAAGRPKDLEAIAELEALLQERERQ